MSAIKHKDTTPELIVRSLVHRLGYRFRLCRRDLPGKPDLVFPAMKKVVLVHGCFWHQHPGCRFATRPATRPEFWAEKLDGNRARDKRVQSELKRAGWQVLVVWECQTRDHEALADRLIGFLERG